MIAIEKGPLRHCGLEVPDHVQGLDISATLDDPTRDVRRTAFSVAPSRKGFLLRDKKYAYIQYREDASGGIELFDMKADPKQYTNLAEASSHQETVQKYKDKLAAKLAEVRNNDL